MAVLGGCFVALMSFVFWALTCDETCNDGPGWHDDPDAWQWDAQLVLAGVGWAMALAGALLMFGRRRARLGTRLLAAGVLADVAWAAWMDLASVF